MQTSYSARAKNSPNPVATRLLRLMDTKKTNLCVSADFTTATEILKLAAAVSDEICVLKTHIDIIEDFSLPGVEMSGDPAAVVKAFTDKLREIAAEKNFLIFEDRKFADIGNTVAMQFEKGIYHIADWADIVNVHAVTSFVNLDIMQEITNKKEREIGLLVLAQMTPKQLNGSEFFNYKYAQNAFNIAFYAREHFVIKEKKESLILGFIGSSEQPEILQYLSEHRFETAPEMLIMTPGIQLESGGDGKGQTYNTPDKAISNGSDVIIVGRGIYEAVDPAAAAAEYRAAGWAAYEKRIAS